MKAVYQPEKTYRINFAYIPSDYRLETDENAQIRCNICLQPIYEHVSIIRCPSCDNAFHKEHLYKWITQHSSCPVCKAKLRIIESW